MSNRRTTRKEDIAYSLIGIFAVSMMIAYGEGEEAFFRLQREIMQNCDERNSLMGREAFHPQQRDRLWTNLFRQYSDR